MNDNNALIAEARRAAAAVHLATDERVAADLSRIIHGLADALEAATPVVDRDALVALLVANREVVAGSARDYVDSEGTADLILSSGLIRGARA